MSFPINSMVIFHSYVNVYQRLLETMLLQWQTKRCWKTARVQVIPRSSYAKQLTWLLCAKTTWIPQPRTRVSRRDGWSFKIIHPNPRLWSPTLGSDCCRATELGTAWRPQCCCSGARTTNISSLIVLGISSWPRLHIFFWVALLCNFNHENS